MNRTGYFLAALLLVTASLTRASLPPDVDGTPLPSLAPMLEQVMPAVVNIATQSQIPDDEHPLLSDPLFRWFFGKHGSTPRKRSKQSLGSGVIVDAGRGYVLTNHHVVEKAEAIQVTLMDGRKLDAELVGADPETDVAVLRIPAEGLTAVRMGDSDKLRVGDFAVAIGNPFGLAQTVTSGIVSALGRSGLGIEGYENFIQTDASINPGNSGGPLVNLRGELVGINTAIFAPSGGNVGIGFAIPVNMAQAIMEQIVEYGGVNRGLFGIVVQELTPELAKALEMEEWRGALVAEVEGRSPAEQAGIQPGDVILRFDGREVVSATDVHNGMALLRVGEKVELEVMRKGRRLRLAATIGDPYAGYVAGKELHPLLAGALYGEIEEGRGNGRFSGIGVGKVTEGTPAAALDLRDGDIVLVLNEQRVEGFRDLEKVLRKSRRIYMMKLLRGNSIITLINR